MSASARTRMGREYRTCRRRTSRLRLATEGCSSWWDPLRRFASCSWTSGSLRRHPYRAVEPDHFAVEHLVADDLAHQRRELARATEPQIGKHTSELQSHV